MECLHTCLNVADGDEAVEWYEEQLGFEEQWSFETDDGKTVNRYVADPNGYEIQLSDTEGETEFDQGTAWDHIAVKVDDVDAAVEEIDHFGIVEGPRDNPASDSRIAFVRDPDGHVVELVEPAEETWEPGDR